MPDTLVMMFHPDPARSRANRALADAVARLPGVEVADMGALRPNADFDAEEEVARVLSAGRIVVQYPVQWYATPPSLKAWMDLVLSRMFYVHPKTEGARLSGTPLLVAATAGNVPEAYAPTGVNLFPLKDLLRPMQSTAHRCGLPWADPFLLYRANKLDDAALAEAGERYAERLTAWRAAVPAREGWDA